MDYGVAQGEVLDALRADRVANLHPSRSEGNSHRTAHTGTRPVGVSVFSRKPQSFPWRAMRKKQAKAP
ncbi:MAG: hypothetical protein BWX68_01425 [Verrucomicrobia bacterium ADurb.Bin063]|nr:MAG: hypothetical protein BWX68_01425 [Verrucomicrobia bacterium ADurb.Bin063]